MMKSISVLLLASAIGANAMPQALTEVPKLPSQQGPGCQALPGGVNMGPSVEMRPQDIPTGCSAFEVLVGKSAEIRTRSAKVAKSLQLVEQVNPITKRVESLASWLAIR
jgi:hypothetical protein